MAASGAQAQFFTAPFGPGGTWNLYEITNNAVNTTPATATWKASHQAAIAKTATSTGVSGVAGNATTGHLVAIGSWEENAMVSLMAIRHFGNSNVWTGLCDSDDADLGGAGWADAQPNKISDQWFWAGYTAGGTGTGPNGWAKMSEGGNYQAFFNTEPNGATEDAVEIRTDGRWNDLAHNTAATVRRSCIEWEIASATPIAGATVLNPFFTAPYGAGGTWNLYMVVGESDTWLNAHNKAISIQAQSTGLAGVAGNTLPGHLLQISSRAENSMGVALQNRMLTFNNQLGGNTATTNGWIGLTDSDIAPFSTVEAGTSETTNWVWAGTTGGGGPNDQERIEDTLENLAVVNFWFNANAGGTGEPNDSGGEDAGELRGDGRWNDLPLNAAATVRHYIVEWDVNATGPIDGAIPAPVYFTAQHGAGGTWNLYRLDYTQETYQVFGDLVISATGLPASATGIPTLSANTTKGHLIEIGDAHEGAWAYRLSNYTGGWLGLTDYEPYGGQESGNASANPTNQVHPFWIWGSADPLIPVSANSYRRWNAGEPNDSFNATTADGEDAGEMTNLGVFNDNQRTLLTTIRKGLLEWDIQSATPVTGAMVIQDDGLLAGTRTLSNPVVAGTWSVKEIRDPVQAILTTALATANTTHTNGVVTEGTLPVINLNDRNVAAGAINYPGFGDVGLFGGDLPYLNDTLGVDDNQIVRIAQTRITVTDEDDYTINVHTDDGFALRVPGQTFTQVFGAGFIEKDTLFFANTTGDSNTRGVLHLVPGTYDLEFISYEATSGSSSEVSWARGVFATDEAGAGQWSLIGTPATSYPAPFLPSTIANGPAFDDGVWGLHIVGGAGTITTLSDALAALQNPAGTHTYATSPVINHSDPESPGTGGIFAGELTLPIDTAGADNDFAVHGRARVAIATAGLHTICFRGSEWVAIRMPGQVWQNVGGESAIDPAEDSTVFSYRNNSANSQSLSEFVSRAVVNLPAGCHEIAFITGDRDGAFFMELYSRAGNVINTGEYANSGAANGGNAVPSGDYRLIGYKGDGTLGSLGVTSAGWIRRGTTPVNSGTAPGGWPGTNIANHIVWLTANGVTTDPTARDTVNERDPNSGGPGSIVNDRDFWRQPQFAGTVDDNYYVEGFDARLVVPEAGTYSIGWQGDDGGFIEILGLPAGVGFSRFESMAVPTPAIVNATDGTVNGRIQLEVGGGNTRTMARIAFPNDGSVVYPAEYEIRSLHFEGNGGSYWEIFSGPASGYGRQVTLLQRDQGLSTIPDVDGLQLVGPDLDVLSVSMPGGNTFSFTFRSVNGLTYTIERSADHVDWVSQGSLQATGSTTTYTSGPLTAAEMRYFYRAIK